MSASESQQTLGGLRGLRVSKIAVFRALMLGDLLCAVPALRAIKAHWPKAEVTLVGLPWARDWASRSDYVDHFEEFPGYPGLPERQADIAAFPPFLLRMQAARYDLAMQMHGSGNIVNQLVACFGAARQAGFHEPGGYAPDSALCTAWPEQGHEIERMLTLTDRLGIVRMGTHLEFPVTHRDCAELGTWWPGSERPSSYVCVHAGAQLASRQWMPERFAAVADALATRGHTIVLTGTAAEAAIAGRVAAAMRTQPVDLVGRTSLWALGALVESASLVVSNDTGIMHIAAALQTPSVAVSSGADVSRWAPLDTKLHEVLWKDMICRPCAHALCPYDHGCARAIEPAAVIDAALRLLESRPEPGRVARLHRQ
jgi:ADP-heptose:LPS heptosyltransferase